MVTFLSKQTWAKKLYHRHSTGKHGGVCLVTPRHGNNMVRSKVAASEQSRAWMGLLPLEIPFKPPQTSRRSAELKEWHHQEIDSFLLNAAESLHRYGTPSYRLESVMEKVAESLHVTGVFLYTPTALVIGLKSGRVERSYVRRVDSGDVDISKLLAVDAILGRLEAGEITVPAAADELRAIEETPPAYRLPVRMLAAAVACVGVAVIFGGTGIEAMISGVFGFVIAYMAYLFHRFAQQGLLEPVLCYNSLTAMIENDTIRGVELAFSMSIIGVSLVGGLLLANQLISPKRIL